MVLWKNKRISPGIELPQELIDAIIDNLHGDKGSLASCTLVTRKWVQSARYHLFESIVVRIKQAKAFDRFLLFIDTAPVPLTSCIQHLRLAGTVKAGGDRVIIEPYVFVQIIQKLPTLVELKLERLTWSHGTHPSARREWQEADARPIPRPTPLSVLSLVNMIFAEDVNSTILQILQRVVVVRKVILLNTRLVADGRPSTLDPNRLSNVKVEELLIHRCLYSCAFFMKLLKTDTLHSLHTLTVDYYDPYDAHLFSLQYRNPSLHLLHLNINLWTLQHPFGLTNVQLDLFSVASCTSLQTLGVYIYADANEPPDEPLNFSAGWSYAIALCSSTPQNIRCITVTFMMPANTQELPEINSHNWSGVDQVLSSRTSLQSMMFRAVGWGLLWIHDVDSHLLPIPPAVQQDLVDNLPTLSERGLLKFQ